MKVAIDGVIYQSQSFGGISRIYNEILPRMCSLDDNIQFTLLLDDRPVLQSLPTHTQISNRVVPRMDILMRPQRLWKPLLPSFRHRFKQSLFRFWLGTGKDWIWHSTYYTRPERWKGAQVVTVADMIHERGLTRGTGSDRFFARKKQCVMESDVIICISEATRRDLFRFYGTNIPPTCVIHLGHDEIFRQMKSIEKEDLDAPFLISFAGWGYKNFTQLAKAYAIWPYRKEIKLAVISSRWSKADQERLVQFGIQRDVILLSHVDDEKLCRLYNQAIGFVFPSIIEGFGIPLLEAMACGCPIVASRIPSTREIAKDCPIYFELGDVESLLSALNIVANENKRISRIDAGFERVTDFSWEKTAKQTLKVYQSLNVAE